ncbi:MAG: hypothetical protein ABW007_13820, partial [Chitinophagaceae bacterium]
MSHAQKKTRQRSVLDRLACWLKQFFCAFGTPAVCLRRCQPPIFFTPFALCHGPLKADSDLFLEFVALTKTDRLSLLLAMAVKKAVINSNSILRWNLNESLSQTILPLSVRPALEKMA